MPKREAEKPIANPKKKRSAQGQYPGVKVGGKGGGSKKRRMTSDGYMTK